MFGLQEARVMARKRSTAIVLRAAERRGCTA
jgi:hypothetical protein